MFILNGQWCLSIKIAMLISTIKRLKFYIITILFFIYGVISVNALWASDDSQYFKVKGILRNKHIDTHISKQEVDQIYPLIASFFNSGKYTYSYLSSTIMERQQAVNTGVAIMEVFGSDIIKKFIKSFKDKKGEFIYFHDQQHSAIYDTRCNLISFGPQVWDIDSIWSYPGLDKVIAYIIHEIAHTAIEYNENTRNLPYRTEEQIVNKFTFTQKQQFNKRMGFILPERRKRILARKVKMYSKYDDLRSFLFLSN